MFSRMRRVASPAVSSGSTGGCSTKSFSKPFSFSRIQLKGSISSNQARRISVDSPLQRTRKTTCSLHFFETSADDPNQKDALWMAKEKEPTCWVDGGGVPGLSCCPAHANPQRARGCRAGGRGRGAGWKEHGSMFPACRGQPVFQNSRSRPPSTTRHVASPLSSRSMRLRSPNCLSDTWF